METSVPCAKDSLFPRIGLAGSLFLMSRNPLLPKRREWSRMVNLPSRFVNMEISRKHEQALLSRTIVEGSAAFDGATISNAHLARDIASSMKTDPSLVVIKRIRNTFGRREAVFSAVVYSDAKAKASYEIKTKKMKEADIKAQKEAAEAAKANPKEAATPVSSSPSTPPSTPPSTSQNSLPLSPSPNSSPSSLPQTSSTSPEAG